MMLMTKLTHSLCRVFPDETFSGKEYEQDIAAPGQRFSFNLSFFSKYCFRSLMIKIDSPLAEHTKLRKIKLIPADYTGYYFDEKNERTTPGLFPDCLDEPGNKVNVLPLQWRSIRISVDIQADCPPGLYEIKLKMFYQGPVDGIEEVIIDQERVFTLRIAAFKLMPLNMIHTEWFHVDCIANWYNCEVWSEKLWKLLERYLENYAAHNINMILTPLWTPPLDTREEGERRTVQLLDIRLKNGKFEFDFSKLKRWIDLCRSKGIVYFEMVHFFSQWGARSCPKIMVEIDGKPEKMFGWHTAADCLEYIDFLNGVIPALEDFLAGEDLLQNVYFHISDEPEIKHLDSYRRAVTLIKDQLRDFPIIDAMSDLEFFRQGVVNTPVPSVKALDKFVAAGQKRLWTYYFCGNWELTPNRFFTMPLGRVRIIGVIAFLYDLEGFLHWGYNFWNSDFSRFPVNPFITTDADNAFPAGDAFLVYPGKDGPLDSLRYEALMEGMQDHRLLSMYETFHGREAAIRLVHEGLDYEINMTNYPYSPQWFKHFSERLLSGLEKTIMPIYVKNISKNQPLAMEIV